MKGRTAALDAACARVNPGLVLVAAAIALLDFAVAAQRWAAEHPPAAPIGVVTVAADTCFAAPALELQDRAGRD